MGFWADWLKKEVKQTIEVNEKNIHWLMNEEINRLYGLLNSAWANNDKNRHMIWNKIETFQKTILELSKKDTDDETRKAIADIQNQLADSIILGNKE